MPTYIMVDLFHISTKLRETPTTIVGDYQEEEFSASLLGPV